VVFNLYRMAAIMQGIMKRFVDGTASNENAESLGQQTPEIADIAWGLAEGGAG